MTVIDSSNPVRRSPPGQPKEAWWSRTLWLAALVIGYGIAGLKGAPMLPEAVILIGIAIGAVRIVTKQRIVFRRRWK